MWSKNLLVRISLIVFLFSGGCGLADCPSADLTGDCFVDFEDFAIIRPQLLNNCDLNDVNTLANQLPESGVPTDPCIMVWVDINDSGVTKLWLLRFVALGHDLGSDEHKHKGFNGQMSKYETTNAQYCVFLNDSLASGDIYVSSSIVHHTYGTHPGYIVYGANGTNPGEDFVNKLYFETYSRNEQSQIDYNNVSGTFSVRTRDSYDMSNHPVVAVSWYGATAFCNYYGYRLPTEWEWQAVADFDGTYKYGCGKTISQGKANVWWGKFANPLGLSDYPYTSPVDYYEKNGPGPYGYGMCDMAGNVYEWTDSWQSGLHISRVVKSTSWICTKYERGCVWNGGGKMPGEAYLFDDISFRVVLDSN